MKQNKDDLPTVIDQGGVCFRGIDWSEMNVSKVQLPKGADAKPLLAGLPQNLCQCPHWGYVLRGSIQVTYSDGTEETVNAGQVYYWPPGHSVRAIDDYEAVEFSPASGMAEVMSHLAKKMAA